MMVVLPLLSSPKHKTLTSFFLRPSQPDSLSSSPIRRDARDTSKMLTHHPIGGLTDKIWWICKFSNSSDEHSSWRARSQCLLWQAEMPPGHPSLSQVILLGRIKFCEPPGDLIWEREDFQAPQPILPFYNWSHYQSVVSVCVFYNACCCCTSTCHCKIGQRVRVSRKCLRFGECELIHVDWHIIRPGNVTVVVCALKKGCGKFSSIQSEIYLFQIIFSERLQDFQSGAAHWSNSSIFWLSVICTTSC